MIKYIFRLLLRIKDRFSHRYDPLSCYSFERRVSDGVFFVIKDLISSVWQEPVNIHGKKDSDFEVFWGIENALSSFIQPQKCLNSTNGGGKQHI